MNYLKQLDSLRAIAVMLVITGHWITTSITSPIIPIGAVGVDIFFVLSGFLISSILFANRKRADISAISYYSILKNFYLRRMLRIFPVYYLVIFLLLIFHRYTSTNIASAFPWFFTYTSNFYFFKMGEWGGVVSHLWSLSVEEQYYLLWPWLLLFANKKYFLHIIFSFIAIGIVSQYIFKDNAMGNILTFTCFDAFGLGALLAWQINYSTFSLNFFYNGVKIAAAICLVLLIAGIIQKQWAILQLRTIVSVVSLAVITHIVIHQETGNFKFKFIFNNRCLIFLGKISYGLYLYHNIIPTINNKLINKYINVLLPDVLYKTYSQQLRLVENSVLLVFVSWLSFILFEKRFLLLKKYFIYENEKARYPPKLNGLQEIKSAPEISNQK